MHQLSHHEGHRQRYHSTMLFPYQGHQVPHELEGSQNLGSGLTESESP